VSRIQATGSLTVSGLPWHQQAPGIWN